MLFILYNPDVCLYASGYVGTCVCMCAPMYVCLCMFSGVHSGVHISECIIADALYSYGHACTHGCMYAHLCISAWMYSGVYIAGCTDPNIVTREPYIHTGVCIPAGCRSMSAGVCVYMCVSMFIWLGDIRVCT